MTCFRFDQAKHGGFVVWSLRGGPMIEDLLFAGSFEECVLFLRNEFQLDERPAVSKEVRDVIESVKNDMVEQTLSGKPSVWR